MIAYTEKYGLKDALNAAGYSVAHLDGAAYLEMINGFQPTAQDEIDANALIAAHDPLTPAKLDKIAELKIEGLRQANLVYDDEVFASVAAIELLIDIDATYDRSIAPAARLIAVNSIINTFKTERAAINSMEALTDIQNYNVTIDPAW